MPMSEDLQSRLRRLGVVRGIRNLKPTEGKRPLPPKSLRPDADPGDTLPHEPQSLAEMLPGGWIETTVDGACFVLDKVYPLTFQHGQTALARIFDFSPQPAAVFCRDERFQTLDFHDFVFLDTETTGLWGAGTLAFMVGLAFFERGTQQDVLVLRQYFLRDQADEAAMLVSLAELLRQKVGLITFNGRTFDLPLLDSRYLMNRMPADILEYPHIDLLLPARRLWRNRLGSVALSALEDNLLAIKRTHADVSGWLIPNLYHDYLRSGDAREMSRVFYHNQIDLLSMVVLTAEVVRQFAFPADSDHALDLYSLARWQADLDLIVEAERNFRRAAAGDLSLEFYHQALQRLGGLLKRNGRRDEAVSLWQQWAATSYESVEAHIELAKHFEWHVRDLPQALYWTEAAIQLAAAWWESQVALIMPELTHRRARIQRKMNS